ncbi:hypothetical protein SynMINOS11_01881 [Synechococcus sp. Minos11]|nr:hypothetical protein SynMINOS11_01881 [Synechococcus sp. Minos11]
MDAASPEFNLRATENSANSQIFIEESWLLSAGRLQTVPFRDHGDANRRD